MCYSVYVEVRDILLESVLAFLYVSLEDQLGCEGLSAKPLPTELNCLTGLSVSHLSHLPYGSFDIIAYSGLILGIIL